MNRRYTGNSELIKELNQSMVLSIIQKEGQISRVEIAKKLGLSPSTVTNITKILLKNKQVVEVGEGESTGGRKPRLLKYNLQGGYVAGVYIGEVVLRTVLADLGGEIVRDVSVPTKDINSRSEIMRVIVEKLTWCLQEENASLGALKSLGVAVSGVTDVDKGVVLDSRYLHGLRNYPLADVLRKRLGVPVFIDNDMFMAALGEKWMGQRESIKNMLFITIGVGIGVGCVINGQVYRGSSFSAGELGNMCIYYGEGENAVGHLENSAGWKAIERLGCEYVRKHLDSQMAQMIAGNPNKVTHKTVFDAACSGDDAAIEIIKKVSNILGLAIVNVVNLFDPEVVILGGEIVNVQDLFAPYIKEQIKTTMPNSPPVEFSRIGRDAEIYGAIKVALGSIAQELNVSSVGN